MFKGRKNFGGYTNDTAPVPTDTELDTASGTHRGGAVFFDPDEWACGYGEDLPSFWPSYYSTHYSAFAFFT